MVGYELNVKVERKGFNFILADEDAGGGGAVEFSGKYFCYTYINNGTFYLRKLF